MSYLDMCPQPPTAIDVALCEALAVTGAQLQQLNAKSLQGELSQIEARLLTSLSGQHARLLKQLRMRRSSRPVGPSLDELFATENAAA